MASLPAVPEELDEYHVPYESVDSTQRKATLHEVRNDTLRNSTFGGGGGLRLFPSCLLHKAGQVRQHAEGGIFRESKGCIIRDLVTCGYWLAWETALVATSAPSKKNPFSEASAMCVKKCLAKKTKHKIITKITITQAVTQII